MFDHIFLAAVTPTLIIGAILARRCLRLTAEIDAMKAERSTLRAGEAA